MGKQYNKEIKRRRRKDYLKRRAELEKAQIAGAKAKPKVAGKGTEEPVKKKATKKKAAKKKAPKAEVETLEIPVLEEEATATANVEVAEATSEVSEEVPDSSTKESDGE